MKRPQLLAVPLMMVALPPCPPIRRDYPRL